MDKAIVGEGAPYRVMKGTWRHPDCRRCGISRFGQSNVGVGPVCGWCAIIIIEGGDRRWQLKEICRAAQLVLSAHTDAQLSQMCQLTERRIAAVRAKLVEARRR